MIWLGAACGFSAGCILVGILVLIMPEWLADWLEKQRLSIRKRMPRWLGGAP